MHINYRVFIITGILMLALTLFGAHDIVVDDDHGAPGFTTTGEWTLSEYSGYNGGEYHFFIGTSPLATATWTPDIPVSDFYDVYAIFLPSPNRATVVPYTIEHRDGTTEVSISQYAPNYPPVDEVHLGEFYFNEGASGSVTLSNTGSSGVYIADAIRFVTASQNPPSITQVQFNPETPEENEPINVTADITSHSGLSEVKVIYDVQPSGITGEVTAYDDGEHGDGTAGNNIYGAFIPGQPSNSTLTFYFSATDILNQTTTSDPITIGIEKAEYRVIWVDSWDWPGSKSFLTPQDADELVQTCRENNINTIMIQVTKIGDAAFDSNINPRATNIPDPDFDPLRYLLDIAHDTSNGKKYIQIHAWFVMQRIDTVSENMRSHPDHILNRHPEYVMLDRNGNDAGGGRIYMDPGHPGAVEYNIDVILDCMENYEIDGVNLDYIRYPEASGDWGYNPTSIDRFNAAFGKTGTPATNDPDWSAWRRLQVTNQVKKIYVRMMQLNPDVILTADTINWGSNYTEATYPSSSAYNGVYQDWRGWLREGIIDYNALMNYSPLHTPARYEGWTNFSLANDSIRGSIIGIGAYLHTNVQGSMDQLLYARDQGATGLNIYDWYSEVNVNNQGETRSDFYRELKDQVFTSWVYPPEPEWKKNPTKSVIEGTITMDGTPVDYCRITLNDDPETTVFSDGMGWYGILEVPPGSHQLTFIKDETEKSLWIDISGAGQIITVDTDLNSTYISDWMRFTD